MEYRGVEYSVVQLPEGNRWRWKVRVGDGKTKTGVTPVSRAVAINDCGKRNPPGKQSGASAAEPVARGVRRRVAHRRLGTGMISAFSTAQCGQVTAD
jgi:hypothetical protein